MTVVSWIIVVSTKTYEWLLAARILQGMAMGVVFTVVPVYVAEISESGYRGALCGLFQTFWVSGVLFAYLTGPFLSYEWYAVAAASVSGLFLLVYCWAPESPYFLLMEKREEEAEKSLIRLRGLDDVRSEMRAITVSLNLDRCHKKVRWKDLVADRDSRRALVVVSSVCFVKYMSGTVAITGYVTATIAETSGGTVSEHLVTIGIGLVMLAASLASAYLSDIIGRKPLIFTSVIGAITFNAVSGTYFLLHQMQIPGVEDYSWIAYAAMASYCVIANIGLSPLLQTLQAECFSSRLRGHAGAYVSFLGTLFIFLSLKQYQPVVDAVGVFLNYYLFSVYALVGSIAIFAFMKETAGKSLDELRTTTQSREVPSEFVMNEIVSQPEQTRF